VEQWEHGTTHVVGSTLERAATSAQSYFDIHRDARGALKRRQRARVTLRMNTCPCYSMERAANSNHRAGQFNGGSSSVCGKHSSALIDVSLGVRSVGLRSLVSGLRCNGGGDVSTWDQRPET